MDRNSEKGDKNDVRPRIGIINFEKRRHPRFTVDLPLEYCRIDTSIPETGRAVNASEEKLLVYFPEEVNVGDRIQIKLFFTTGAELNTVETTVEVAWVDIHLGKEWGDYRSGVRFIDIRPEDLNKLKNFLRQLSR